MAISLPPLPYARDGLEPFLSRRAIELHYEKHHGGYVDALNSLVADLPEKKSSLEEIIFSSVGDASRTKIFNNAAQAWNHSFYWRSMKSQGGGPPTGPIAGLIDESFGDFSAFRDAFALAGAQRFGSGWVWLVAKDGRLLIRSTPNAMLPLTEPGARPLLTMDVWEHAYYLDYQNRRASYVVDFLDHLLDWDFANANLEGLKVRF